MGSYGGNFARWIHEDNPEPYGSWGNGAPKETAADNIEKDFGWLPEYRPFSNPFDESSMNAVPVAVGCFL